MNDFKKRNKVDKEVSIQKLVEMRIKEDQIKKIKLQRERAIECITSFYNKQSTKEEEEELLAIDERILPNHMFYTLCGIAKEYIRTGKVREETFFKYAKARPKKISLGITVPEEWQKDPKKKESEKENAR